MIDTMHSWTITQPRPAGHLSCKQIRHVRALHAPCITTAQAGTALGTSPRVCQKRPNTGRALRRSATSTTADTQATLRNDTPSKTEFDWYQQWYPIIPVSYLDPIRPLAFTLLGQQIVIWKDAQDGWSVLDDRCPHRLAPLSEGRIEPSDGKLQCSYHGWRFDAAGNTVAIPQLDDPQALSTACTSKRSCVRRFPSKVHQGLLWVWADSGPSAEADSQQRSPPTCPELDDPKWSTLSMDWFFRDVPYSIDTLLENLFDPSHVPFAHHNVMRGADRNQASSLQIQVVEDVSAQGGFKLRRNSAPMKTKTKFTVENEFLPPVVNRTKQMSEAGRGLVLQFYATPLKPGWCRLHTAFVATFKLPAIARLLLPLLEWRFHIGQNRVLDSDNFILHVQEQRYQAEGGDWKRSFYLPAAGAEVGVVKYRTWFHEMAGGGVPWPRQWGTGQTPAVSREVALDRYAQHTQHCRHCQAALAWIKAMKVAALAAAAASVGAFGWQVARGALCSLTAGASLFVAGLLSVVALKLQQLQREFNFTDFVHAFNN